MRELGKVKAEVQGFVDSFNALAEEAHANSVAHQWWESDRNNGEMIALIHAELSEALEALRHGNPPDSHIPEFSGVEAELADVVIRIFDMSVARGWRVAEAVVAKMEFNKGRPIRHGNREF